MDEEGLRICRNCYGFIVVKVYPESSDFPYYCAVRSLDLTKDDGICKYFWRPKDE